MKKRIAFLLTLVMVLGLLCGCGSIQNKMAVVAEYDTMSAPRESYETAALADYANSKTADVSIPLPQNRKWIITIHLDAETDDLDASISAVTGQIEGLNGYIENQQINNLSSYRSRRSASLTVRIPADQVDSFVAAVSGIANVVSKSRNVQDITLEYSDTEGRITALKTEEQRLLELMEKAENMSDLLEIESRLTEVRYQLENHSRRLRLYDNQVDYATVHLSVTEVQKYTPVEEPGFWKRISEGLSDSIVNLGETIVDTVVWFIVNLPYLIVLGLIGWGVSIAAKKSSSRRKAKREAKKQEKKD